MYYCGWDGGGTKTEVRIVDESGELLTTGFFGPLNPNGSSKQTVAKTVRDSLDFMSQQSGGLDACGGLVVGFAGISNKDALELMDNLIQDCGYKGQYRIMGDQEIALAGAIQGPGAVLIAGTGAICFGRDLKGERFRVGGYGYLIDDGGSGYAIGRDILSCVARAADGRAPSTCLTELAYNTIGSKDISGVITWLYAPTTGKKDIAALAPLLTEALKQDDPAAKEIAHRAAEDLSELVCTAWKKTQMTGGELALTGSILTRYESIRAEVIERCHAALPQLNIISPRGNAAQGAASLAVELFKSN